METTWTDPVHSIELKSFFISEEYGFVLEDPLTELPRCYQPWMDVANNLTHLIKTHQLRDLVKKMPLLSTLHLHGYRQLRLAHLALGFITMGYVWQEGLHQPAQALPRALAVPYCNVSQALGLPPILVYADCVLANWRLKDPSRPMEIGNLDTIFSFPGGESGKNFFLVSMLVEKSANSGIQGVISAVNAMVTFDISSLHKALQRITLSLKNMEEAFRIIHNHVDPKIFHGTFRIYLSGWRDNPLLPDGLWYEGVREEPLRLSGGSAAQSSSIQSLDTLLGIQHDLDSDSRLSEANAELHAPVPSAADRDCSRQPVSALLRAVQCRPLPLSGVQHLRLCSGGTTELPPQRRGQVHHSAQAEGANRTGGGLPIPWSVRGPQ
ncbi:indoleamine 2,3-dioxygenase 2-like isoform X2 [Alosa sapidissima]|uniref:indoleamine 2,3-dioxygenase 2-like isoform X2 n=1 Tax=Alosa sapidissima TaxID=34773 RepID=UPI001C082F96|nr:indoleamine 2,3-dioxygenase 2-like isoform X2 [Alosa sapidissima]